MLFWFPLVGALLGCISCLFALLPLSAPIRSVLVLIGGVYFTRALHYDGVADLADGLGGGFTKERSLEIMRDSHIRAFGTIALILVVLLQYSLLLDVVERPHADPCFHFGPVGAGVGGFTDELRPKRGGWLLRWCAGRSGIMPFFLRSKSVCLSCSCLFYIILCDPGSCRFWRDRPQHDDPLPDFPKAFGGITGDVLGSVEVFGETAALLGIVFTLA